MRGTDLSFRWVRDPNRIAKDQKVDRHSRESGNPETLWDERQKEGITIAVN
jgi:hypothetical protein